VAPVVVNPDTDSNSCTSSASSSGTAPAALITNQNNATTMKPSRTRSSRTRPRAGHQMSAPTASRARKACENGCQLPSP
jgi:hypothetical protein